MEIANKFNRGQRKNQKCNWKHQQERENSGLKNIAERELRKIKRLLNKKNGLSWKNIFAKTCCKYKQREKM